MFVIILATIGTSIVESLSRISVQQPCKLAGPQWPYVVCRVPFPKPNDKDGIGKHFFK